MRLYGILCHATWHGQLGRVSSRAGSPCHRIPYSSLLIFTTVFAFLLGLAVSSIPGRFVEEFRPATYQMIGWESLPGERYGVGPRWSRFKTGFRWYSETPFQVNLDHQEYALSNSAGDRKRLLATLPLKPITARRQLLGHDWVALCEFSYQDGCLSVYDVAKGRNPIWSMRLEPPADTRFKWSRVAPGSVQRMVGGARIGGFFDFEDQDAAGVKTRHEFSFATEVLPGEKKE